MSKSNIYLDNNATTQIDPQVFEAMKPFLTGFYGNPSSSYSFGTEMRQSIAESRTKVADLIGASSPDEIFFTSGGTESNNWSIFGTIQANPSKKHIISTKVEHESVRKVYEQLEQNGYEISLINVNEKGLIDLGELRKSLRKDTALVSTMLANNETGVLFPIDEIGTIVKEHSEATFHVDGVNAVGKIPIDLKTTNVDLFSISGHKFYAPKGIGALYIKDKVNLPAISIGGGQEKNKRAGTEAVHQVVALGKAAEIAKNFKDNSRIRRLRDKLETEILEKIPNAVLNGDRNFRTPNTSNISFPSIEGEAILASLDENGVYVSTGSACNSETHTASPVLQAMNVPYFKAKGAIRFSFGKYNSEEEVDFVLSVLPQIIARLTQLSDAIF